MSIERRGWRWAFRQRQGPSQPTAALTSPPGRGCSVEALLSRSNGQMQLLENLQGPWNEGICRLCWLQGRSEILLPSRQKSDVRNTWSQDNLRLQRKGHLMRRVDSLVMTLMLGGIGGKERRGQQRIRWLDAGTLRSESETQRKPEVPASLRGEALFRCRRPSGIPRGPATSTGSLASQRHPGKFPKVPGRRRGKRGFPTAPRERPRLEDGIATHCSILAWRIP